MKECQMKEDMMLQMYVNQVILLNFQQFIDSFSQEMHDETYTLHVTCNLPARSDEIYVELHFIIIFKFNIYFVIQHENKIEIVNRMCSLIIFVIHQK